MLLLLFVAAFFLGSIPCGYLAGRMKGIDIRRAGSGNTGATNAGRVLGKKIGFLVLLCDIMKGVCALTLAEHFLADTSPFPTLIDAQAAMGFTSLMGHCFSPFLSFRGGKGVATATGVFLYLTPFQTFLTLSVFFIILRTTGYVSLGSIASAVILPILIILSPQSYGTIVNTFAVLTGVLVIIRHHANIRRLLSGEESKFARKSA